MAIVTGNIRDIMTAPIIGKGLIVEFVLCTEKGDGTPVLYGDFTIDGQPKPATLDTGSGSISINVAPNTQTHPDSWYRIRIRQRYADTSVAGPRERVLPGRLVVPPQGGTIKQLLTVKPNTQAVFIGSTRPEIPSDWRFVYNPDTGIIKEWSDAVQDHVFLANLHGPQGERGKQGIPGIGGEATDAAVAAYLLGDDTASGGAARELIGDILGVDPLIDSYGFNLTQATLGKWRSALALAAGAGTARITVSGDSIPWGAGSGNAHLTSAWPGRLQRMFEKEYGGKQGTGAMPMLRNYGTSGGASEQPVLTFSATGVEDSPFGVYQLGSKKLTKNGTSTWVQLGPVFGDVARITFASSPGLTARVWVAGDDGVLIDKGTIATSTLATGTTFAPLAGFASRLVVTDVPLGGSGWHSIRIVPEGANGTEVHLVNVETLTSPARGVVVSNMALSGITSQHLVVDDATYGQYGMSVGFDATRSHLHIIQIGINDWQQHYPVSEFKARLVTAVRRAKSNIPVINGGTPSNGDVLLVVTQWVNTGLYPADHINSPSDELYMQAVRDVAIEETAAGLDLRKMAANYTEWAALGYDIDGIHPSPKGHEAIAAALFYILNQF